MDTQNRTERMSDDLRRIGYVNHKSKPDDGVLILAGAILILALAVVAIRDASARYGSSHGIAALGTLSDSASEAKRS